jgi:hypothetical protein
MLILGDLVMDVRCGVAVEILGDLVMDVRCGVAVETLLLYLSCV